MGRKIKRPVHQEPAVSQLPTDYTDSPTTVMIPRPCRDEPICCGCSISCRPSSDDISRKLCLLQRPSGSICVHTFFLLPRLLRSMASCHRPLVTLVSHPGEPRCRTGRSLILSLSLLFLSVRCFLVSYDLSFKASYKSLMPGRERGSKFSGDPNLARLSTLPAYCISRSRLGCVSEPF